MIEKYTDEILALIVVGATVGVNGAQVLRGLEPVFPWEAAMLVLAFYFMKRK